MSKHGGVENMERPTLEQLNAALGSYYEPECVYCYEVNGVQDKFLDSTALDRTRFLYPPCDGEDSNDQQRRLLAAAVEQGTSSHTVSITYFVCTLCNFALCDDCGKEPLHHDQRIAAVARRTKRLQPRCPCCETTELECLERPGLCDGPGFRVHENLQPWSFKCPKCAAEICEICLQCWSSNVEQREFMKSTRDKRLAGQASSSFSSASALSLSSASSRLIGSRSDQGELKPRQSVYSLQATVSYLEDRSFLEARIVQHDKNSAKLRCRFQPHLGSKTHPSCATDRRIDVSDDAGTFLVVVNASSEDFVVKPCFALDREHSDLKRDECNVFCKTYEPFGSQDVLLLRNQQVVFVFRFFKDPYYDKKDTNGHNELWKLELVVTRDKSRRKWFSMKQYLCPKRTGF